MPAAHAQQKTDTLDEVNVRAAKKAAVNDLRIKDFAPGQQLLTIDSVAMQLYRQQAIADLLTRQVPVFVKSYGFNSLATLNFRGSSAAQSQVLWEGVPIQNAALGMADVSLLPVSLIDRVHIVYGSSSALLGSGNVGGALLLEQKAPSFSGRGSGDLSIGMGSFGQRQVAGGYAAGRGKWYVSVKATGQLAQNNFRYANDSGIYRTTGNAKLEGGGAIGKIAYRPDSVNTFSLTGWYQAYNRQIPAALFETISVKQQKDRSLRLVADWQHKKQNYRWYAKAAYIADRMRYDDSLATQHTANAAHQFYGEAGWEKALGRRYELLVFSPVSLSAINSSTGVHTQEKLALAAALKAHYLEERLRLALAVREELINGKSIFLPGINAAYNCTGWLQLRANVQRTYRAPNLNELYYEPGGNDNLRPERGWNEDAGYSLRLKLLKNLVFEQELAVYNRQLHDWIIWFGGSIWTPHNIAVVHSRGIETGNRLVMNTGNWKLHLGLNTAYTMATTVSSYIPNDNSYGKQIPYAPRWQWQVNAGFTYKGFYLNYNHSYTGYRYLTTDESSWLEPYTTGNVQLMYELQRPAAHYYAVLQCNNLWNARYEVVSGRVMPGINWLAAVGIKI